MNYYLGLDMGTNSVGWAVTDTQYHLLRAKGKDLWGARLFDEASTAETRRAFRTGRRRLQREKARIGFLKEVFSEEINKVDPGFYQRLEDSKYFIEDKTEHQPFSLFADKNYTDKEYHDQYPTIFHLRKELIDSVKPHDVRLVYLAILNIFKHRGHFLNRNLSDKGQENFKDLYYELCNEESIYSFPDLTSTEELEGVLSSKKYSNTKKWETVLDLLDINKKSVEAEMLKMICGLSGTISKIFVDTEFDEDSEKIKICFRDMNLEETMGKAEDILGEEEYECILLLKKIHDWALLASIMPTDGPQYLSYARVESYEKHHKDLLVLKRVYKKYARKHYDEMFRIMSDNNYSAYSGSVNSKIQQRRGGKRRLEDFYKIIKSAVSKMPKDDYTRYILEEIEKETFLPKQLTNSNGVIPMQIHKMELSAILKNAERYLDFLTKKDDTGIAVSQKILDMFGFQIPYYVGPLVNTEDNNAWVIRKEEGKVYPWNFNEKIDVKASSEEFIKRMVKHCTYLNDESVLPKDSLLYQKFMVLNELNNLKINGEPISSDLKQNIYNDLFSKGKKVKKQQLINYLKAQNIVDIKDDPEITGIDNDFVNTLSSLKRFKDIYGVENLTQEQKSMTEKIIYWATIYGDSVKFLREKIKENYGDKLSDGQIKRITSLRFKEWGRLSRQMLTLEGAEKNTGEIKTIISRMWDENYNLMELLSDKFTYIDRINDKVSNIDKSLKEFEYEDLDPFYLSAPVKRMVWQTILIIKELHSVLKSSPKKIFVEMARDVDAKKERKDSRKKKFLDLYKACKDDGINWSESLKDIPEERFRSKKLYLYYTQKGRCMYTGDIIDIQDLFNDNLYDIDHIYPRHYVKDDSLDNNCVLVKKEKNAHKSDVFPLEDELRKKQAPFWKMLADGGFISKEKYSRLMRRNSFTMDELAQFISRQIVETRQGTKFIAQLFKEVFPESSLVYVKAGNVSSFRQNFNLLKCRAINDFHHANDAYLNIVVGNVYDVKFTRNPINFIREYKKDPKAHPYHMSRVFDFTVKNKSETAWVTENNESISIVKAVMKKNTPLITQMNYETHGGFADQTIYSADEAKKAKGVGYVSVKSSDSRLCDTTKYGGFKKFTGAYFFLVEYTNKGKRERKLEPMPLYLKHILEKEDNLEKYCAEILGYKDPSVRVRKIKMNSLIKVNGYYMNLTGRTGNRLRVMNAVQLILSQDYSDYIRLIQKDIDVKDVERLKYDSITAERNIKLYDEYTDKFKTSIYRFKPNAIGDELLEGRDAFVKLTEDKQIYVLNQILTLFVRLNNGADLTLINGSKSSGVSLISSELTKQSSVVLVNQSVTGLFEKEIDLLKI